MERPAIMLRFSVAPAIEKLSDSDAGRLVKCALNFGEHGVVPDFSDSPMLDVVWALRLPQLQRDEQRYAEKCQKNRYSNYCGKARKNGETPLDFDEWLRTQPNATVCSHSDGNNNSKGNDNKNSNNNSIFNVIEIEDNSAAAPPPTKKGFVAPSVDEVQSFAITEGLTDDAENFVNYYQSIDWKSGKSQIVDWRARYRSWVSSDRQRSAAAQYTSGADRLAMMIAEGRFDD